MTNDEFPVLLKAYTVDWLSSAGGAAFSTGVARIAAALFVDARLLSRVRDSVAKSGAAPGSQGATSEDIGNM
jgi:hypothetical protein